MSHQILLEHADALFSEGVLLFSKLLDVRHNFRGALAKTLRCLLSSLLVADLIPDALGVLYTPRPLAFISTHQKATGRIHLSPDIHNLSCNVGLLDLAAGKVTHLVFPNQLTKLDVAKVVVGATAATQQHIMRTRDTDSGALAKVVIIIRRRLFFLERILFS